MPPQRVTSACRQSTPADQIAEVGRDVSVLPRCNVERRTAPRTKRSPSASADDTGSSNQRTSHSLGVAPGPSHGLLRAESAVRVDVQLRVRRSPHARHRAAPDRYRVHARASSSRAECPADRAAELLAIRSSEYEQKPPLPYTGTASWQAGRRETSGTSSKRACSPRARCRPPTARTTRPGPPGVAQLRRRIRARPLRVRRSSGRARPRRAGPRRRCRRLRRVRPSQPVRRAGPRFDEHDRRRVPLDRPVRLRSVRRDRERRTR